MNTRNSNYKILLVLGTVIVVLAVAVLVILSLNKGPSQKDSYIVSTYKYTDSAIPKISTVGVETPVPGRPGEFTVTPPANASWAPLEGEKEDTEEIVLGHTDLVVKGVVERQNEFSVGEDRDAIQFTVSKILVTDSIAGKAKSIDVIQTGGSNFEFDDSPLLIQGGEYVLFLSKTPDGDFYMPVGERIGVALIDDKTGGLEFTSPGVKDLMTDFQGKTVAKVKKLVSDPSSDLFVN